MNNKLLIIVGIVVIVLVKSDAMGYQLKEPGLQILAIGGFLLGLVFSKEKKDG